MRLYKLYLDSLLKIVLISVLLYAALSTKAQAVDSVELFEVEIIEFSATDLAISDQKLLSNVVLNLDGTEDYLTLYSEAFVRSYGQGGFTTIALDGLQPRHTQVFWNGLPVNASTIGITDVSAYPINESTAISILKSADSYRFTGSQMGGSAVIENYFKTKTTFDVQFKNGSFGTYSASLGANKFFERKLFKIAFNTGYNRANNNFKYSDYNSNPVEEKELQHGGNTKYYIQPGFEWRINDKNLWQINILFSDIIRELAASIVSPNNFALQKDKGLRFSSHWKYKNGFFSNNLIIGYLNDQFDYEDKSAGQTNFVSNYATNKIVINETTAFKFKKNTLKLGTNLTVDFAKGSDINKVNLFQASLFTIWKLKLIKDKLQFSSSVRGEFQSESKPDISGIVSIESEPFNRFPIFFRINGHRNIRYTTINDLYFKPSGNEDLKKESSWQFGGSINIDKHFRLNNQNRIQLLSKIEAYSIYLEDMIVWVPSNKIYWQPINLTSVHSKGLKLNTQFIISNKESIKLHISQFYQLAISTNRENIAGNEVLFPNDLTIGKQLPYIPKHQLKLNTYLEINDAFITLNSRFTSERFITGSNSYFLQKFWMIDAFVGYTFFNKKEQHQLKASIGLKNLLGNNYYQEIAHIPMPGRNYQLTLKYSFKK